MQPVFLWGSDRKIKMEQAKQKFGFVLAAPGSSVAFLFCIHHTVGLGHVDTSDILLSLAGCSSAQRHNIQTARGSRLEYSKSITCKTRMREWIFYIMSWAKKKSGSVFFFLVFSDLMLKVHYVLKSWGVGEDWLTDSFCLTKQNKQTLCFLKEQHNFTLFDALFTFGGPGHLSSFKQYSGDLISLWEQLVCSVWK